MASKILSQSGKEVIDLNGKDRRFFALVPVLGVIAFNLWQLRDERIPVPYLNDSSVHVEMARFASQAIRSGHLPLDSWYPYLGLGSEQFAHYQSLASTLIGLIASPSSVNSVFAWSIYLLVSLWPLCVFSASRVFGLTRWQSSVAAVLSPFILSATGVGYEQVSYLYIGFGIWTQLWAMWTLPFAWAFSWRAVSKGRSYFAASIFIALTICFHYISGYVAILGLVLWVLLEPSQFLCRLGRAGIVAVASFCMSAWVLVPLVSSSKSIAFNEVLQHTVDSDSYGARRVLSWLFTGHIFDNGRLPIISALALVGFIRCVVQFRKDERYRALVIVFLASLVMFFGRPTLGPLLDVLPASQNLFLRRFIMGVQLSGVLMAGVGATYLFDLLRSKAKKVRPELLESLKSPGALRWGVGFAGLIACAGILAPAWTEIRATDANDRSYITYQAYEDNLNGTGLDSLISAAKLLGDGRIYSGNPANWGLAFRIGSVPVFKYLANDSANEVGYTLRTQSLMTDPENYFQESSPGEFSLFGIRYLLLPTGRPTPVSADLLASTNGYSLWQVPNNSYLQVIDTTTPITENRLDIGSQSAQFVSSDLPSKGIYPTVAYSGAPAATPTLKPNETPKGSAGSIIYERADLVHGRLTATIDANRAAVVLLKVSYDPGWRVSVDGRHTSTEMIAPAMVGVRVTAGIHTIRFRYVGYGHYLFLFALALIGLVVTALFDLRSRRNKQVQNNPL